MARHPHPRRHAAHLRRQQHARKATSEAKKEGRQKAGKVPKARGGVNKKPSKSAARGKKK
jgi:hypothetical protein